jgi:hypothetical protein
VRVMLTLRLPCIVGDPSIDPLALGLLGAACL